MNVKKVKELIKLFKDEELTKLKIEEKGMKIHIEKGGVVQSSTAVDEQTSDETAQNKSGKIEIKAPQVGTFYMQKEEGSDENFVDEGDTVQKGDQVGIIEAMKVFNDVHSDHSGVIEEILVENGDTVEYDQVLMTVRKEGE
ncbi:acetyl-CoA carboxylase biotin carboxyl carrier protein subunit [Salinicoccus sp. YB14-2]|uniref:acetyl-CoA carboxylase biotin carboxyl carrier protein n=1 Tax=Salinicoccus sp. YB14-2 TaxID=1572701 RepID=UPI00068F6CBC|nr:acetyl-CoA carboxylase biotin carboxyl carrier protein subunit [Salinicoccus sp. YB14-2]